MKLASVQMGIVPFGVGPNGSLWIPSEPGLWPVGKSANVMPLKQISDDLQSIRHLRSANERRLTDLVHLRLQQLLSFLDEATVDVCVFPEYALPCDDDTLTLLLGFSQRMTIVAGLGQPRSRGVEALSKYTEEIVKPSNNVVAVFTSRECFLVTKRNPAEGEQISRGDGARIIPIATATGTVKLGVAICKDYLVEGHSVNNLGEPPDILAIPAFTTRSEPFVPEAPRDFPRVFANSSSAGGSTVFASGCEGVFVEQGTPKALPAGTEGVISVDWHGPPSKPTQLLKPPNVIHIRSSLITETDGQSARELVSSLRSLAMGTELRPSSIETIPRWIRFLEDRPPLAILRDSVATYRDALGDEVLNKALADILSTHIMSADLPSVEDLKRQSLESVASELDRLMSNPPRNRETYLLLLQAAESYADWRPGARLARSGAEATEDSDCVLHFQVGFGPFDRDRAAATIPSQEDFLTAFLVGAPQNSRISFILLTEEDPATGSTTAQFFLRFFGPNTPYAKDYFKRLEPITRSVFVRGWSLYKPREIEFAGFCTEIRPESSEGQADTTREDLGLLVDALRAAGADITLEMTASAKREKGTAGSKLELGIRLYTPEQNEPLAHLIGSTIFPRGWKAIAVDPSSPYSTTAVPLDVGLNVLHPPDGHIQSRGVSRRRRLEISAPEDMDFSVEGASLGRATVQHPAIDKTVEVRIPDSSRTVHTYVIGRTGSGKTNTLKNIVRHDLSLKSSVVVIDPHGDLFDYALRHTIGRRGFVSLDFSGERIPSINPIYLDADDENGILRNIDELVEAMVTSTYHQFAGPRFRDIARLCLETLVAVAEEESGRFASLADVPTLIEDRKYRDRQLELLKSVGRNDLRRRWDAHHRMKLEEQAELEQWFVSKFSDFRRSTKFSAAVSGRPDFSLDSSLRNHLAVLIRVPTTGLGIGPSRFLGSLIVERVLRYTLERGFNELPDPASLIVDEFQAFVGTSFLQLIPEARKFNLAVTVANQTISQLSSFSDYEGTRSNQMAQVILGNVGNLVVQSVGHSDADRLGDEMGLTAQDVMRIGKHSAATVLTVRGLRTEPFTVDLLDASERPGLASEATLEHEISASIERAAAWVTLPKVARAGREALPASVPTGTTADSTPEWSLDRWLDGRKSQTRRGDDDVVVSQGGNNEEGHESLQSTGSLSTGSKFVDDLLDRLKTSGADIHAGVDKPSDSGDSDSGDSNGEDVTSSTLTPAPDRVEDVLRPSEQEDF